ncbi:MAG: DUF2891 domain-containing protein [Planctomycetaceae bacterium]|nr:DUF2891 domain-containing protein [Planctomycetaceae bacterium]
MTRVLLLSVGCWLAVGQSLVGQEKAQMGRLTDAQVTAFAKLALKGIPQEYPNKPSNVMNSGADVRSPKEMHPAFYGNFDWHSSVHGHWMLVRLLRDYPKTERASEIRAMLNAQLTLEKMQVEAKYFEASYNKSFERMYGWAWLLQLVRETHTWEDADAAKWRENLKPLEAIIVKRINEYLPKLTFPIRVGTHTDTSFALSMILDYARTLKEESLEALVVAKAKQFYAGDRNYPAHYEPSGHDFFSSGFNEADLMRRILPADEFSVWLDQFLPQLKADDMGSMMEPVEVSDVTDGHLVHLAGLDLARAWTMNGVAQSLPKGDPRRTRLEASVAAHAKIGLTYVTSGHYEGEHWLATFAVYHLTQAGLEVGRR